MEHACLRKRQGEGNVERSETLPALSIEYVHCDAVRLAQRLGRSADGHHAEWQRRGCGQGRTGRPPQRVGVRGTGFSGGCGRVGENVDAVDVEKGYLSIPMSAPGCFGWWRVNGPSVCVVRSGVVSSLNVASASIEPVSSYWTA